MISWVNSWKYENLMQCNINMEKKYFPQGNGGGWEDVLPPFLYGPDFVIDYIFVWQNYMDWCSQATDF